MMKALCKCSAVDISTQVRAHTHKRLRSQPGPQEISQDAVEWHTVRLDLLSEGGGVGAAPLEVRLPDSMCPGVSLEVGLTLNK